MIIFSQVMLIIYTIMIIQFINYDSIDKTGGKAGGALRAPGSGIVLCSEFFEIDSKLP